MGLYDLSMMDLRSMSMAGNNYLIIIELDEAVISIASNQFLNFRCNFNIMNKFN